jgi:hypothetical protein
MKTSRFCLMMIPAIILGFVAPARAVMEQRQLTGHVPAAIAELNLQPISRLPATNRLNLAIALPLHNQAGLEVLLQQISDPASLNFRHYLTPEQFVERFGPSEKEYEALVDFATAQGLVVTRRHPNRMLLSVSASAADIEKAFHVTLQVYQHPTEARTFYAPDVEPSVPAAIPILGISGFSNFSRPKPHLTILPANQPPAQPLSGSGPGGEYMGKDFRAAYVPGPAPTGTGQIVGLLEFDGYTASDITYYESAAGLPSVTLSNVLLDGFTGAPSGSDGQIEVSLDIEVAISMAPGQSKVLVYEAGPDGNWHDILNQMATDNLAKQMSCSWYDPYVGIDPVANQIFQQMAAQGQSFFVACGDSDAYTGEIPFPDDTPYVTEVGGTTLTTTGPGGPWVSETVWNWGIEYGEDGVGTGGGISTQYPIPAWQTNVNMSANQGSKTMRNIPDVALTADNVYVRAMSADDDVGGTSCAAPLWAAFMALVNQQAASQGAAPLGFLNPTVYKLGLQPRYGSSFHDIVTGNNTWSGSPTKFYAVTGYDLCSGWGTPDGTNTINALLSVNVYPVLTIVGTAVTGGNGTIVQDECAFFNVSLLNYGLGTATVVNATLSTTTPGITVVQPTSPYPTLVPGATASNTVPFQISTSPSYVCGTPVTLSLAVSYDEGSITANYTIPSTSVYAITQTNGASIVSGVTDTGNHCVDCCTMIGLPFAYPLYGQTYTNATISSNGILQFTGSNNTPANLCLPTYGVDQTICPLWQFLRTDGVVNGASNGVYTSTSGTAPNRIFNVEWRAVYYTGGISTDTVNFEVRLYEDQQRFDIIYGDLNGNGSSATVGVQNDTNNVTQFECSNGVLFNGLQLTFQVPPCPDGGGQCQIGLLGDWTFDEGSGNTAYDSSGNTNTGTIVEVEGNPISWVSGLFSNALYFDGLTQVIVSNSPSLNPFSGITISAWVDASAWGSSGYTPRILEKGNSDNQYELFSTAFGQLEFFLPGVTNGVLIANAPSTGSWHHVASTFNGSNMILYIDGQIAAEEPASGVLSITSDPLAIGSGPQGSVSNMFSGAMNDVRVYGSALSAAEIAGLYNTDTVGDGIPNWWRQRYFGNGWSTNSSSCAACDADGTGQNNLFKYIAGLDPTNPASAFGLNLDMAATVATGMLITNGLVAYYAFNGNANDASGNGNNGTVVGATFQTNGPNGQVTLDFAGNMSSYVIVPESGSLEPSNGLSIAMWCNGVPGQACGDGWGTIVRKAGACQPGYLIRGCNGGTGYELDGPNVCGGGPRATAEFLPFTGTNWQYIVGTYSVADGMVKTYEQGVLLNQTPFTNQLSHSGSLYIGGADVAGGDGGFNGSIYGVCIYNRSLSAAEVQQLYEGVGTSMTGMVASVQFGPVGTGRTYTPQFCTDLVSGVWLPLTTCTGLVTNNDIVTITDTNPIPPQEFYRISISKP